MSFEDFMAGTVDARVSRGSFDHSTKTLAPLPLDATDAAKTGREAELKVVQSEIAAKFDADYLPCAAQMGGLFAQAQSCRTLGQMLPLRLFQAQGYMIGHLVTLCQAYQADADVLAKLGLPGFQAYLKRFADDAVQAQAAIKNTVAAGMPGPGLEPEAFFAALNAGLPVIPDRPQQGGDVGTPGPMTGWPGLASQSTTMPPSGGLPFLPSPPFGGDREPRHSSNARQTDNA